MEEIYTYLGYALIAVLIYLIFKTIFVNKQPEGFFGMSSEKKNNTKDDTKDNTKEDTKDNTKDDAKITHQGEEIETLVTKVENATNQTIEQLNFVGNRKHWENLIIALEDNINTSSIQHMARLSGKFIINPEDPVIIKAIENLNALNNYKQTLKDNMIYLDGLA